MLSNEGIGFQQIRSLLVVSLAVAMDHSSDVHPDRQISNPVTTIAAVNAGDFHSTHLIPSFTHLVLSQIIEIFSLATRTGLARVFDHLNACLTETIATATNLISLSKNKKAYWTLVLNCTRWLIYQLTVITIFHLISKSGLLYACVA